MASKNDEKDAKIGGSTNGSHENPAGSSTGVDESEAQWKQEMLSQEKETAREEEEQEEELDEWDKRLEKSGCAKENEALQLCHYETGDWRQCLKEMDAFKKCWQDHKGYERTHAKENDVKDL